MLFAEWWIGLENVQQIFWSMAIVASVLLFILMLLSLFGVDLEHEPGASGTEKKRSRPTEPKTVLVAFTLFGWTAVVMSYLTDNIQTTLLISLAAGIIGALLPWLLAPLLSRPGLFDLETARSSTGEVLRSVPPHRSGFGKVHINLRTAPFRIDAVTAGEELPPGAHIRVVDIIDERVLLVEALEVAPEDKGKIGEETPDGEGAPPHSPGTGK